MVARCCRLARRMAEAIAAEPGVELMAPVELNQFMIRFGDSDALTAAVIRQVQADAVAFLGGADWRGRWVMRVSVTSSATDEAAADASVASVIRAWRQVTAEAARTDDS
jgi:glutamate/tyrosine decarboxylase-like PLP-dependent enzyme